MRITFDIDFTVCPPCSADGLLSFPRVHHRGDVDGDVAPCRVLVLRLEPGYDQAHGRGREGGSRKAANIRILSLHYSMDFWTNLAAKILLKVM